MLLKPVGGDYALRNVVRHKLKVGKKTSSTYMDVKDAGLKIILKSNDL